MKLNWNVKYDSHVTKLNGGLEWERERDGVSGEG